MGRRKKVFAFMKNVKVSAEEWDRWLQIPPPVGEGWSFSEIARRAINGLWTQCSNNGSLRPGPSPATNSSAELFDFCALHKPAPEPSGRPAGGFRNSKTARRSPATSPHVVQINHELDKDGKTVDLFRPRDDLGGLCLELLAPKELAEFAKTHDHPPSWLKVVKGRLEKHRAKIKARHGQRKTTTKKG